LFLKISTLDGSLPQKSVRRPQVDAKLSLGMTRETAIMACRRYDRTNANLLYDRVKLLSLPASGRPLHKVRVYSDFGVISDQRRP